MGIFSKHSFEYRRIKKSKLFNKNWYKKNYLDSEGLSLNPIEHYITVGWKKGYNPSLYFDGNAYLSQYQDVKEAGINPLFHYENYGKKEGRKIFNNSYVIFRKKYLNFFKRHIAKIIYRKTIQENKNTKILVVLHLFYMNSWDCIKQYLDNLKSYNFDLVVTCVDGMYDELVFNKIKQYFPGVRLFVYENKGFDIGPFIDVINKIDVSKYNIVFKLHSKGSRRDFIYIYNQIFKNADWFFNLYDGILGAFSVHKTINVFMKNAKIGLVASKNLIVQDPKHKNYFTQQIANKYKVKIKSDYQYVAGSCFAVRAKCLKSIIDVGMNIDSFEETKRGFFSLAHGMERIVCATVESQGFKFYGIQIAHPVYKKELKKLHKTSAIRLLNDDRFVLNNEFFYLCLEGKKIKNYYLQDIALKDINRSWKGEIFKLDQCAPYDYLNDKCVSAYQEYCEENKKLSEFEMSVSRFDALIQSMENNGFDSKYVPVINSKNNVIMDGQHRCCYLLKKFGPDYKVKALFLEVE